MENALSRAIAALRRKERSVRELDAWLAERDVGGEERRAIVEHLVTVGELDDERFARRYAEDKRELAGWGAERIRDALRSRLVDTEIVEAMLAEEGPEQQLQRAGELLVRRGEPLVDNAACSRALGYLTRRGYDYETAHSAISRLRDAA